MQYQQRTDEQRHVAITVIRRAHGVEQFAIVGEVAAPMLWFDVVLEVLFLPTGMEVERVTSTTVVRVDEGAPSRVATFLFTEKDNHPGTINHSLHVNHQYMYNNTGHKTKTQMIGQIKGYYC